MSSQALREFVNQHIGSTTILAALGALLDAKATGTPLHPAIQAQIDEVLDALNVHGITEGVNAADLGRLLAEIRFSVLLDAKLLFHSSRSLSWTYGETELLQAGGEVSAGFADALTQTIVPQLDGLSQQLGSRKGWFLDVGVGVAGLSVAMANLWPSLNVVGIDRWAPVPGSRPRERAERWPLRPHSFTGRGGRGFLRYRCFRSRLDSERLRRGEGNSSGLRTRMPCVASGWMAAVCDDQSRYRSSRRGPRTAANGALGRVSYGPGPGRDALERNGIR